MAQTGDTGALDTERESQVTHGDLDHGVSVHMRYHNYPLTLVNSRCKFAGVWSSIFTYCSPAFMHGFETMAQSFHLS